MAVNRRVKDLCPPVPSAPEPGLQAGGSTARTQTEYAQISHTPSLRRAPRFPGATLFNFCNDHSAHFSHLTGKRGSPNLLGMCKGATNCCVPKGTCHSKAVSRQILGNLINASRNTCPVRPRGSLKEKCF